MTIENEQIETEVVETVPELDAAALNKQLEEARKQLAKVNKEAASHRHMAKQAKEALGDLTPEEVQALRDEREQARLKKAEEKGEFDKLRTQLLEKHQKEKDDLMGKLKQVEKTVESYLVDNQAMTALAAHEGNSRLLMPHIKSNVKVVVEDGAYKALVLDADGSTKYNNEGNPMSVAEYVADLRNDDDFAPLFKAKGVKSGTASNAGNTGKGAAPSRGLKRSEMSVDQKAQYVEKWGTAALLSLPR